MKKVILSTVALSLCTCAATTFGLNRQASPVHEQASAAAVHGQPQTGVKHRGKTLVAYFSVPETDGLDASSGASRVRVADQVMGSTRYVATVISQATGGDLFEIKTVHTYPGTHKALIDAAKAEADAKAHPKLASHITNLGDYDVVFVGFPNWWYDMPMPIYTFFEEYDFGGKTIIPFCTHGGSRFSDAIGTIRRLEKKATVLEGYSVSRDHVADSKAGVLKWLDRIGLKK